MADVQLSALGPVIKAAYEGQSDTNPFTDSALATLAALTVFDDETFNPTAINLSRHSAPDFTQSGAVQLALDGGITPVAGAVAWIAWTGDGSDITCDGTTVTWPDGTAGAKSWTGERTLMVGYHPALANAVAFPDGAGDFATAAQGTTADAALPRAGGTMTGAITLGAGASITGGDKPVSGVELTDISEPAPAVGDRSGAASFDYTAGGVQRCLVTGNITSVTITDPPPTGRAGTLTIVFQQDATGGRTITWGSGFRFPGGADFTLSVAASAIDLFTLMTWDAGSTWYVFEGGKGFAG